MNNDNRKRALAEVVSLDAWHKAFTHKVKKTSLYVDVVFTTGRIGGTHGDDVRFRLRLKRAEVVVIVPMTEPARIDKMSVSRDAPNVSGKATQTYRTNDKSSLGGRSKAKVGQTGLSGDLSVEAYAEATRSSEQALTVSQAISSMRVTQSQDTDGNYVWVVEPTITAELAGRPWDAAKQPRLAIIDERADRTKGIEPTIRVEMRCRREDLEISDIKMRSGDHWSPFSGGRFGRNKIVAAEALIRTRLFQAGLVHGELDDPFAQMTLCATLAESAS